MSESLNIVTVVMNDVINIEDTVNSIAALKKKFKINYIVLDGGSVDGTYQKLKTLACNIDILISEPDLGIYDAMNKSLNYINNDFLILWLNSGDLLLNIDFLDNKILHEFEVVIASTRRRESVGRKSKTFTSIYAGLSNKSYFKNRLHHQSFLIRKRFFGEMKYDHASFGLVADLFFMLKNCNLAKSKSKLLQLKDVITAYKPDGVSDIPNFNRTLFQLNVMRLLGLSPIKIILQNPYKFSRMVLKSLVPHSIGKLFT